MESTLTTARESTLRQRDLMRMKRRGSSETADRVFANAGGFDSAGRIDQGQYLTEVMYSHNRGEPHAAVRPIAERLASSPFHVAEVVKPSSKHYHSGPKDGRRRLSLEEMARMPKFVRNRLGLPTTEKVGEFVKAVKTMHSAAARIDILEDHPVLDVLSNPNPRFWGHTLMVDSVISLMFTGRLYWWLDNSAKKRPYDLWYLPAHRVRETPGNVRLDQPYLVNPANSYATDTIPIPAKYMIYAYLPDPADPMKALAPVQACMQNIRTGEAIVTCQEQMFNNGIFPGLAIITGDIIGPDGKSMGKAQLERHQINEIRARLHQEHKGPMKYYKDIIMDRVIDDVKPVTNKPQEMGFRESYEDNKKAIWGCIGTPPVIAGNTEDANRATALVADESFTNNVVNPLATLFSHIVNDQLLPLYNQGGDNLVMWLEESVSSDRDQELKEATLLAQNRGMTVNELRSKFGYPPLPESKGDVLWAPATSIFEPLDDGDSDATQYREDLMEDQAQAGKPAPKPGEGKPPKPRQNPPPSADETATGKSLDLVKGVDYFIDPVAPLSQGDVHKGPVSKDRVSAWLKVHSRQEVSFQRDMDKFLRAQVKYIASQIAAGASPAQAFNPREWDKGLLRVVKPHLLQCAATGAQNILNQNPQPEKDNVLVELTQRMLGAIRSFLNNILRQDYWKDINDTTAERLRTQLDEAITAGESTQQTSKRVSEALGSQVPGRALNIARSETTGALGAGARIAIDDMIEEGAVAGYEWLATDDAHVRPTHWAANGQVADKDGFFTVGGEQCQYPGDASLSAANRCNCRCAIISVIGGKSTAAPSVKCCHKSLVTDRAILARFAKNAEVFQRLERRFLVDEPNTVLEQLRAHGMTRDYGVTTLYLDQHRPTWSVGRGGNKFRLRQYENGATFLEEKFKINGITHKTRRQLSVEEVTDDLVGIGLISYLRTEFEQDGHRITIDRNVDINGRQLGKIVVEVKGELLPDWLQLPEGSESPWFSKSSAMLRDAKRGD